MRSQLRGASWSVAAAVFTWLSLSPGRARADQAHEHDGFYLRLAGGLAYMSDPATLNVPPVAKYDGTVESGGGIIEVAVGGGVARGLILGGVLSLNAFSKPVVSNMNLSLFGVNALQGDVKFDGMSVGMLAPFVDYYFDPKGGLHLMGAAGLGWVTAGEGSYSGNHLFNSHGAGGFAASVGLGDEWWVSSDWSLGVMGRLLYVGASGQDDNHVEWHHHAWVPSLLFTATMN